VMKNDLKDRYRHCGFNDSVVRPVFFM